jgi:nicotinamidase-related amidase
MKLYSNSDKTVRQYRKSGIGARVGFGSRPAILVIDFSNGFTDPASPLGSDLTAQVLASTKLLQAARGKSVPIVFSTVSYSENLREGGIFLRKVPSLSMLRDGSTWVEIDPRLRRRSDEMLLFKRFASCFFGTSLASYLTSLSVDTLILAGATTSGCVRATAVDGMQNGFRVIVPSECVGDRASGPHEANLLDIDSKYGDVVSLRRVLSYLRTI